jgi:hypothetical protein
MVPEDRLWPPFISRHPPPRRGQRRPLRAALEPERRHQLVDVRLADAVEEPGELVDERFGEQDVTIGSINGLSRRGLTEDPLCDAGRTTRP